MIRTGVGGVPLQRAKIRDRGADDTKERFRFTSAILPRWGRRSPSLDALLPVLYLRGVSTGDFRDALSASLGPGAPNLSPSVIGRLKGEWEAEYVAWQKRTKGAPSRKTAKLMVFKLTMTDTRTWCRLKGEQLLPNVIEGITLKDGVELVEPSTHAVA